MSQNRQHLVPTTITNKNGIPTTVYKKPTTVTTNKPRLPKATLPANTQRPTIEEVDTGLYRIVAANNLRADPATETERSLAIARDAINATITQLKTYPEELRRTILDHTKSTELPHLILWVQQGWSEAQLNEYFTYQQAIGNNSPASLLSGLRYYPQLPQMHDYSTADLRTQEQIHALLTITTKLGSEKTARATAAQRHPHLEDLPIEYTGPNYGSHKLEGDELINLVLEHPEHADQIADIIIERNTNDAYVIRSIIAHSTPALSDGTL